MKDNFYGKVYYTNDHDEVGDGGCGYPTFRNSQKAYYKTVHNKIYDTNRWEDLVLLKGTNGEWKDIRFTLKHDNHFNQTVNGV